MAFDYFGVDPTKPDDRIPLSQIPAFLRDAKRAFTTTFLADVQFEAGTEQGDAVYYDAKSQLWRRSLWTKDVVFNIDGFSVPSYVGVTTGVLVHGPWQFVPGTELYLSRSRPGKLGKLGDADVPTKEEGPLLVGKQVMPGVILFTPGAGMATEAMNRAEQAADKAEAAYQGTVEEVEKATKLLEEINVTLEKGLAEIEANVQQGLEDLTSLKDASLTEISGAKDASLAEIQTLVATSKQEIQTQTSIAVTTILSLSQEQLALLEKIATKYTQDLVRTGDLERRKIEIKGEYYLTPMRELVLRAAEHAGDSKEQADIATGAKNVVLQKAEDINAAWGFATTLKASAVSLAPEETPSVLYNPTVNALTFGIPQGLRGPKGEAGGAGEEGPQGPMGPVPFGAAFGKVVVDAEGILTLEYADITGTITEDTFFIDEDGYLQVQDQKETV